MSAEPTVCRHLYIHVPFCSRRCSYCDFSIAVRRNVPTDEFIRSISAEIGLRAAQARFAELTTVYLGGGTPSKLGPDGAVRLLGAVAAAGPKLAGDAEVTIEANPEDVTVEAASGWLAGGFNRLSLGVQTFSGESLAWMHRTHTAEHASTAFKSARAAGFGDISVDLIYALPARLGRIWADDLNRATDLGPDHLSVYGLTVEPRTPLGRWTARGTEVAQTDERAADEFLAADASLTAVGFEHYEVSSYAKPGKRSRHNTSYWKRVPYLGLGPSAHSFDGTTRRWNIAAHAAWADAVARGEDPVAGTEVLDSGQHASESLYLQLRTDTGVSLKSPANAKRADRWILEGWAVRDGERTRLTPEGWLRLDALAASLDPEQAHSRLPPC